MVVWLLSAIVSVPVTS